MRQRVAEISHASPYHHAAQRPGDQRQRNTGQQRIDDETIEKEYGWVFFYQTEKYLRTGNIIDALAGNAPYIVNKYTGELIETGTANPVEEYIAEYESESGYR